MQVNDGTKPCPTCLNATNISTLKAVADMREEERKNAMVVLQLDRDLATLRETAAALIASMKCQLRVSEDYGKTCDAPATAIYQGQTGIVIFFCDKHIGRATKELPYAAPLRALQAVLAATAKGDE